MKSLYDFADGEASKAVGRALRVMRDARGWTAEEVTRRMNREGFSLPRNVIANIESGRRGSISVDELVGLSRVFGCSFEYLLGTGGLQCLKCNDEPPEGYACLACGSFRREVAAAEIVDR